MRFFVLAVLALAFIVGCLAIEKQTATVVAAAPASPVIVQPQPTQTVETAPIAYQPVALVQGTANTSPARDFRKPLVIMSPKSLLRHPAATSRLDDFTKGHFEEIIDDVAGSASDPVNRVILSSGKVYYDLVDYREKHNLAHTALVRVEQLYPLHAKRLAELAKKYAKAKLVWCQEEPENAGAGRWIMPQLEEIFGRKPVYAGRPPAASPAVGLLAKHRAQLASFLKDAFTL